MNIDTVFNDDCQKYLDNNELFVGSLTRPTYSFTKMDEFKHKLVDDPVEGAWIYWHEMLARAHMAAVTSVYRSRQWVESISISAQHSNALGFAASLRGLIESAADTATSLIKVPMTLAEQHKEIDKMLRRKPLKRGFMINSELEDELIHFVFARKLGKDSPAPRSHAAKTVSEYLKILDNANISGIRDTYQKLCDLTHPGASSILIWLSASESEENWRLQLGQEDDVIEFLATDHERLILELLMYAFNAPALVLAVLNYFPPKDFHTPKIKHWNLSGIPAWVDISKRLRKAKIYA